MNRRHVRQLLPNVKAIEESVVEENERILGFHCSVRLEDGSIQGSGCHRDQKVAREVSLAEAIERQLVKHLLTDDGLSRDLLLNEFPTSCGFALGTDQGSTIARAKAEAIERWLRSKWIDDGFALENSILNPADLSSLAHHFYRAFDTVLAYRSSHKLTSDASPSENYFSLIVVGLKDEGAFVGSRVSIDPFNLEEHALLEAWRHLRISSHIEMYPDTADFRQIHYFGTHGREALRQIERAKNRLLPDPKLRILKEAPTGFSDLFLFRALCEDYQGWHGPDFKRFVY